MMKASYTDQASFTLCHFNSQCHKKSHHCFTACSLVLLQLGQHLLLIPIQQLAGSPHLKGRKGKQHSVSHACAFKEQQKQQESGKCWKE